MSLTLFGLVLLRTPLLYRAEAWVLLDATTVPATLIEGVNRSNPTAELEIAERSLLSAPSLMQLSQDLQPFADLSLMDQASALKTAVTLRRVQGGNRAHLLQISFAHSDPTLAKTVTARLAQEVLDAGRARQTARADAAFAFAQSQAQLPRQRLAALDEQVLRLRQSAQDSLPAILASRIARRDALDQQIQSLEQEITALNRRTIAPPAATDAEQILLQLTRTRQEKIRTAQYASADKEKLALLDQRIASLEADLRARAQISPRQEQVGLLAQQVQDLRQARAQVHAAITATPAIADQLVKLDRQRALAESQLAQADAALSAAKAWRAALDTGAGLRWQVVDVPSLPLQAMGPARGLYWIIAAALSVFAGLGAVVVATRIDPRLTSSSALRRQIDAPVLACLPALDPSAPAVWKAA